MNIRRELLDKIHRGADPFEVMPESWQRDYVDYTDEWDSHHHWFDEAVAVYQPSVIIEVGSFLGVSARHWAKLMQELGSGGQVVCVDTWLAERTLWTVEEWREKMRFEAGRPTFYRTFMATMKDAGLHKNVIPLPMDSRNGARYLAAQGITAPVIYIDAGHDFEDCLTDMRLYWKLLQRGGVMIIDDYEHLDWHGVKEAVHLHAEQVGARVEIDGIKARLRKVD